MEQAVIDVERCVATRDEGCASEALEEVRRIAPTDGRAAVLDGSLDVLLGRLRDAEVRVRDLQGVDLDADARGCLLLLRSDIASARGHVDEARTHLAAASPLVGNRAELLNPRRAAIDAYERAESTRQQVGIDDLRTDFDALLEAARHGKPCDLRLTALRQKVDFVGDDGLHEELDAAARSIGAACRRLAFVRRNTRPPLAIGTPPVKPPAGAGSWRMAHYETELRRYEQRQAMRVQREMEADTARYEKTSEQLATLADAEKLVDAALTRLEKQPDAFRAKARPAPASRWDSSPAYVLGR